MNGSSCTVRCAAASLLVIAPLLGSFAHAEIKVGLSDSPGWVAWYIAEEKGFFKNWVTMGMLGVYYLKKNKKAKMKETFEKAVLGSPKESLLWALYAYCLCESGDLDKAVEVLEKGLKKIPGNEQLVLNVDDKKLGFFTGEQHDRQFGTALCRVLGGR